MMERHVILTGDGSPTLYLPGIDEPYHSRHGAVAESQHVFIAMGLLAAAAGRTELRIAEVGLGTGLNALLTALEAERLPLKVHYTAVEAYPLTPAEVQALDYPFALADAPEAAAIWQAIHAAPWGADAPIGRQLVLHKIEGKLEGLALAAPVDLVYFDAFAPEKQPELWSEEVWRQMRDWLVPGGMVVTYCAKGAVRRAMQAAGLSVERLPGPPRKREMLRARRPE